MEEDPNVRLQLWNNQMDLVNEGRKLNFEYNREYKLLKMNSI